MTETNVFTHEEISVAMELIDTNLTNAFQKDYIVYTAVDDDAKVLGYYCIGPTPMTEGTYDLYWIAVKPTVHNQGVGKNLLKHSENLVLTNEGRLLVAQTSSQPKYEPTRKFYVSNRYLELARIKDYYKKGDDLVIYGKYVSQSGESN